MLVYCCHDSLRFCNVPMYVFFFIVLVVLGVIIFCASWFFFWCL